MKEQVLNPQDIKNLKNLSKYLMAYSHDRARVRIELDYTDYVPYDLMDRIDEETFTGNFEYPASDVAIPKVFQNIFTKIIIAGNKKLQNFSPDTDYINYQYIEFLIDVIKNETSLVYTCHYYGRAEPEGYTFEGSEDEYTQEVLDMVKDVCGKHAGIKLIYNGSGDSGYVEGIFDDDSKEGVPADVEDWCYNELERFGGWEINEGSDGYFIFNTIDDIINLVHTYNTEESESITLFEIKY